MEEVSFLLFFSVRAIIITTITEKVFMAKKINPKKVKRSLKSGLNFSKFYFSKSTSVVMITSYSAILLLAFSVLGFSSLISAPKTDEDVPSLPEEEPFTFLPADNLEVPALGEVEPEKEAEKTPKEEPEKPLEEVKPAPAVSQPIIAKAPAVAPREAVKTVIKEVPKEVVKVVEKQVIKEVPVEKPIELEQTHYYNYEPPKMSPRNDFPVYENFPDEDPAVEEPTTEDAEE